MTRTAAISPALTKEFRALLPLWGASAAAIVAAFIWRDAQRMLLPGPNVALSVYIVGSLAIGAHAFGQEYAHRTLPMLLAQPADRRRLYLVKFAVSAVMVLTLAALAATTFGTVWRPQSTRFAVTIVPALCGLFLAPLLTMVCRSTLAGVVLAPSVIGVTWLITLAIAWFGFGIDGEAADSSVRGRWVIGLILASPVTAFLSWRRFARLEAIDVASPALPLPSWLTRGRGARAYSPVLALAVKELHLQQLSFAIATIHVVLWGVLVLLQPYILSLQNGPPFGAALLLSSVGLALVIGALASAEERQHGTLAAQVLQPIAAWQQWMIKGAVTLTLALLLGAGLPVLLLAVQEPNLTLRIGDLAGLVVLVTSAGLYLSSLSSSGVRAMVMALPAGVAVAYFVQMVFGAIEGFTGITSVYRTEALIVASRALLFTLVPVMLWFGFRNHTSSDRLPRRVAQQAVAIAGVIAIVIGVGAAVVLRYVAGSAR